MQIGMLSLLHLLSFPQKTVNDWREFSKKKIPSIHQRSKDNLEVFFFHFSKAAKIVNEIYYCSYSKRIVKQLAQYTVR